MAWLTREGSGCRPILPITGSCILPYLPAATAWELSVINKPRRERCTSPEGCAKPTKLHKCQRTQLDTGQCLPFAGWGATEVMSVIGQFPLLLRFKPPLSKIHPTQVRSKRVCGCAVLQRMVAPAVQSVPAECRDWECPRDWSSRESLAS